MAGLGIHLPGYPVLPGSIAGWGEGLGWAGGHTTRHPLNVSRPMRFLRQTRDRNSGKTLGRDRALDLYAPALPARTSKEIVSAQDVAHGKLKFQFNSWVVS